MTSVLLPWVMNMGWKMQSILLSGLRGPDHALCPKIKEVSRWMRKVYQNNADPSKPYMAEGLLPKPEELEKELEHSPVHFVHHFADALRVIAIHHPELPIREYAWGLHYYIAEELFHFVPETDAVFIRRHRDKANNKFAPQIPYSWADIVEGTANAAEICKILVNASQWHACMPLPCEMYEIFVRAENEAMLKEIIAKVTA